MEAFMIAGLFLAFCGAVVLSAAFADASRNAGMIVFGVVAWLLGTVLLFVDSFIGMLT